MARGSAAAKNIPIGRDLQESSWRIQFIHALKGVGFLNPPDHPLRLNKWYHAVLTRTYSGSTATAILYLNGVAQTPTTTNSFTNWYEDTTQKLYFGSVGGSEWWLNGFISNVQIYNTSLDASQVLALYQKGIGAAPVDPNHVVGWWPLNGDTNDYSGNNNNNNGAATAVTYTSSWLSGYTAP